MKDVINLEKGTIMLNVRQKDINGKSVGYASRVGYKVDPKVLTKTLVSLLKDGGKKRIEKIQISAKEGGILFTVKQGEMMVIGEPKKLISDFLKDIGKSIEPLAATKSVNTEKADTSTKTKTKRTSIFKK